MTNSTMWWLVAGGLVALELFTGTFYLLMLALGVAAAAIAALLGASLTAQLLAAALVGSSAVVAWHLKQRQRAKHPSAQLHDNASLDVGEVVQIDQWLPDGTALVKYRGAQWSAVHRQGVGPYPGAHRVAELIGNRLLVDKV